MSALEISSAAATIESATTSQATTTTKASPEGRSFKDTLEQESQGRDTLASDRKVATKPASKYGAAKDEVKQESSDSSQVELLQSQLTRSQEQNVGIELNNVSARILDFEDFSSSIEGIDLSPGDNVLLPFQSQFLENKPLVDSVFNPFSSPSMALNLQSVSLGDSASEGLLWDGKALSKLQSLGLAQGGEPALAKSMALELPGTQDLLGMSGKANVLEQPFIKTLEGSLRSKFSMDMATPLDDSPSALSEAQGAGLAAAKISNLESPEQQAARFSVNVQFGKPEWNAGLASKVAQMAAQNLNFAEIQLDPPELGPLQVRIQLNHDQASVSFTAGSAQVREALEQGNNRLREMLEGEGLNLVDVDVRDQGQQNQDSELESDHAETQFTDTEEPDDSSSIVMQGSAEIKVGVDDFV